MGLIINGNEFVSSNKLGAGHNIGDIFYTTRLDNELNGAVECNGSQYNFADINGGDNNIQALLDEGKLPSVTISEFDAMVSEKGWCDKIGYKNNIILYPVWSFMKTQIPENRYNGDYYTNIYWGDAEVGEDGVLQGVKLYEKDTYNELVGWYVKRSGRYDHIYDENNEIVFSDYGWESYNGEYAISVGETESTYFKVPKLSAYIIQKENIPVIGNGYSLGITDGRVTQSLIQQNDVEVRVLKPSDYISTLLPTTSTHSRGAPNSSVVGITKDPEKSGMISDLSNDSFTGRVMIQLFNGSTDTALATCTSVLADVTGLKQTTDGMIDYVVEFQEPTAENEYTWYRLYKSGWVEQGGKVGVLNNSDITVTLPVVMANNSYTVLATGQNIDAASNYAVVIKNPTTTTIVVSSLANYGAGATWQVSGMSA